MEKYMITTSQRTKGDLSLMKTKEKADLIEGIVDFVSLRWVYLSELKLKKEMISYEKEDCIEGNCIYICCIKSTCLK